ncbi:hypothetical protein BU23DRAFT_602624 [Bimuria novae-zelandiae CBS 107.79]|uniref:Uncharacterized protein n=1 Tax=Bimuria novae-zelandiae CBS 107.79 TaxID=1447943 RepID=A0A6A5UVA8_9PLEO|nr:hypothetical protein BU23DRAFT_602624 [Bimuria novae-zelandiae CBS 107.79]
MPDRDTLKPMPNVRGEDEGELQYLISIIEALSWHLFPTPAKHPTVLLGRYSKTITSQTNGSGGFVAAVYSLSKGGGKALEWGPEVGSSRKEALGRLLKGVEEEVGRGILRDGGGRGRGLRELLEVRGGEGMGGR